MDGLTKARIRKLEQDKERHEYQLAQAKQTIQDMADRLDDYRNYIGDLRHMVEQTVGINAWVYDPSISAQENRANLMGIISHIFPERTDPRCGSYSGYQRHIRSKETPCAECKAAQRAYQNARRKK